jgi:hypothetical protein
MDQKAQQTAGTNGLVGNLQTDRAKLLGEEFDVLFGIASDVQHMDGPSSMVL